MTRTFNIVLSHRRIVVDMAWWELSIFHEKHFYAQKDNTQRNNANWKQYCCHSIINLGANIWKGG